ncbi:MAG: bactofilin family protein, partial [Pseudonocardiaceae bacterium]
ILNCTYDSGFQGNVQAYYQATPPPAQVASGACKVGSSLYVSGNLQLTQGASVGGNVYSTGTATLNGGFTVGGNVYANGALTISGGTQVNGNVYANGPVTLSGGVKIGGNVFAVGGITFSGGPNVVGEVESQTGSISYTGGGGSGPAYVSSGHTIVPCPRTWTGPSSCSTTLPGDFPSNAVFPTAGTLPVAPAFPTVYYTASAWQLPVASGGPGYTVVTNNDCNADQGNALDPSGVYQAIVSAAAGTTPTVIRTSCQITWGDDYRKGYTIRLNANLALIADGGVNFSTALSDVESTSSAAHDFFLIVPTLNESGTPNATNAANNVSCPADSSPASNVGNVVVSGNLSTNKLVHDLLYTPNSVCTSGGTTVYGKVYAGGQFASPGSYDQQWYDIDPYGSYSAP